MKKILLDVYSALLNLGKAINTPTRQANAARKQLAEAKKKLSETRQKVALQNLKDHYAAQVTLASYGYSRFIIFWGDKVSSTHVTFEYAMITFLDLMHLGKAPRVVFENENGQLEDFTEYFIL